MAIDRNKYIAKYADEGLENINLVETLIFDLKDGVSTEDDLATILRSLHTLKGSSRMLEFKRIESLSHSLESVFVALREQRIGLSDNAISLVLSSLDALKTGFGEVVKTKDDNIETDQLIKNLDSLVANEDFTMPEQPSEEQPSVQPSAQPSAQPAQEQDAGSPVKQHKDSKSETIRLSLNKIDNIIKNIASLQTLEISAKSISADVVSLNGLIKNFSRTLKEEKNIEQEKLYDFHRIERLCERLNSALRNYTIDTGNLIREAYNTVISLRTMPLTNILDSYPRYVFQLSQELGKKVKLSIEGKENEIDKNIIESLSEVFMHMVRNSIDHGIESPRERAAAGKNETGELSIRCSCESGNMRIIIKDDGRGIDHEKIRAKLLREGFVSESAASSLTKEDLTNFIFRSGFSTSSSVSGVSGRGVGMDVVREIVENLKGSIVVDTVPGSGTAFTITVPLSIAALTGFPVNCGTYKFIIPSGFVETIIHINQNDIITVVDQSQIKYNDRIIKLFYLHEILQLKIESSKKSDTAFVVIVRSYDDIMAIAVDNISSMKSVILKTMPSFMEKMSVFSGIVLNEDYEFLSVLHIPALIKTAKRIKTIDIKKRNIEFENLRKSILVVDDSRPTREIESEILQAEGYLVDTAPDGSVALKMAKSKHYDLICTDINMPVMDGFMLTENLKKNEELAHIPVIVISSRSDEEDQKRAFSLGASKYIIKNSFNNHNLLEAVLSLIGENNGR